MKYIVATSSKRREKQSRQKEFAIIENYAGISRVNIETAVEDITEEIPKSEAEAMIASFRNSNPNDVPSYSIPSSAYKSFLNKIRPVPTGGRTKAMGISPGRASTNGFLDFSLETIMYDIVQPGKGENPTPLTGTSFFGRLASQFSTIFSSANRPVMDAAVSKKELPGVEMILVEFTALDNFTNVAFDQLIIEFARTNANRLTVVLSRLKNGAILQTGANATLGLFLDDHDLIP